MREIKFRAWDFESTEWLIDVEEHSLEWLTTSNIHLMQYIGLKDKNSKEAYHKDKVKFWTVDTESGHADRWTGIIEWDEGELCWYVLNDSDKWPCVKFRFVDYFEIIGNLYENPKLMGG